MYFITEYFDPLIGFDIILDPESYLIRRIRRMIFCVRVLCQVRRYCRIIERRSRSPPCCEPYSTGQININLECTVETALPETLRNIR